MINIVQKELKRLRDHEIPYDYKLFGSKYLARIKLTNGDNIFVCPYRRRVNYKNKQYKYKYLDRWLEKNNFEVKLK